jgi:hypothetical protein
MDRSFLFEDELIEASRAFVCIRLATYEDADEAEFLKQIFTGRSGQLENTVFCLLGPDGQQRLSRAGRAPNMVFRSPREMAGEMKKLAAACPRRESETTPLLPQLKNVRLALNVAECDGLPLVVCKAESREQLKSLQDRLAPLACSGNLAGRFVYASCSNARDLERVAGAPPAQGFLVISPGQYGIDGAISKVIDSDAPADEIAMALQEFAGTFQRRTKEHDRHVRSGRVAGIDWQTEIPVTDPMSNRAKEGFGKSPPSRKR